MREREHTDSKVPGEEVFQLFQKHKNRYILGIKEIAEEFFRVYLNIGSESAE